MNLRTHQVVETLVEDTSDEDIGGVCLASFSVDHHLTTGVVHAVANQSVAQTGFLLATECCTVNTTSFHSTDFTANHFENVGNGHS